jgi:hypothetical protein
VILVADVYVVVFFLFLLQCFLVSILFRNSNPTACCGAVAGIVINRWRVLAELVCECRVMSVNDRAIARCRVVPAVSL